MRIHYLLHVPARGGHSGFAVCIASHLKATEERYSCVRPNLQHRDIERRFNMQTVMQSQMHMGLASKPARTSVEASRVGCVSLPLRRQFLSGSRLTCSRQQQKQNAHGRRAGAVSVRAEKVRKT